jgi:hypothetical protein
MVELGWAAPFPIYPDLPKQADLVLLHEGAEKAVKQKDGVWSKLRPLTGYEYRMCCKPGVQQLMDKKLSDKARIADRTYCVDMTTLKLYKPRNTTRWSLIIESYLAGSQGSQGEIGFVQLGYGQ